MTRRLETLQQRSEQQEARLREVLTQRQQEKALMDEVLRRGGNPATDEALGKLRDEQKKRIEELWRELEATADVFMPKTKIQEMFNDHAAQIDELRRLLAQQPEGPQRRFWDENLQTFVESQPESQMPSAYPSRRGSMATPWYMPANPRNRSNSMGAASGSVAAARAAAVARINSRRASAMPATSSAGAESSGEPQRGGALSASRESLDTEVSTDNNPRGEYGEGLAGSGASEGRSQGSSPSSGSFRQPAQAASVAKPTDDAARGSGSRQSADSARIESGASVRRLPASGADNKLSGSPASNSGKPAALSTHHSKLSHVEGPGPSVKAKSAQDNPPTSNHESQSPANTSPRVLPSTTTTTTSTPKQQQPVSDQQSLSGTKTNTSHSLYDLDVSGELPVQRHEAVMNGAGAMLSSEPTSVSTPALAVQLDQAMNGATGQDLADLQKMQNELNAAEQSSTQRIAALEQELEQYRRRRGGGGNVNRRRAPDESQAAYLLRQGQFRRLSQDPDSELLAAGEEWMQDPQVQRLLQVKLAEQEKLAQTRRQIQSKVLELRRRQQEQPHDMSFDEKLAYFSTAHAPVNEELREAFEGKKKQQAPRRSVVSAFNVKYEQSDGRLTGKTWYCQGKLR